jgi:hypothetical protein
MPLAAPIEIIDILETVLCFTSWLPVHCRHRYLMSRLSLQVFDLWCHVLSIAPPFILWWTNFEILFGPLHRSSPFIGELRWPAIQMEHGPYITERTQKAVFIVRCLWLQAGNWEKLINIIFRIDRIRYSTVILEIKFEFYRHNFW